MHMKAFVSKLRFSLILCVAAMLLTTSCAMDYSEAWGDVYVVDEYYLRFYDDNGNAYYSKTGITENSTALIFSNGIKNKDSAGRVWDTMHSDEYDKGGSYRRIGNSLTINGVTSPLTHFASTWTIKEENADGSMLLVNTFYSNQTEETTEWFRMSYRRYIEQKQLYTPIPH